MFHVSCSTFHVPRSMFHVQCSMFVQNRLVKVLKPARKKESGRNHRLLKLRWYKYYVCLFVLSCVPVKCACQVCLSSVPVLNNLYFCSRMPVINKSADKHFFLARSACFFFYYLFEKCVLGLLSQCFSPY